MRKTNGFVGINNKITFNIFIVLCLLVLVSMKSFAQTDSVATLQEQQKLQIKLNLHEQDKTVPHQRVALGIEILSAYPFSDNFTLSYLDLENTVVIQANDRTELTTQEIDGKPWFIQRKEIIVYPLQSGEYSVPEITAEVFINIDNQAKVSGKLSTKPHKFTVTTPNSLQELDDYIASSQVEFNFSQETDEQSSYGIGSAITYKYEITADNVHVLMLPKFNLANIDGIQMYRKPAVEKDVFDRFEKTTTASFSETITFIFQQEGQFTIPQQTVVWWDTVNGELKEEVIKKRIIVVGEGIALADTDTPLDSSASSSENQSMFGNINIVQWLYVAVIIVFLLAILWQIYRHKSALLASFHQINNTKHKQLTKTFTSNINDKNYQAAIACLYQLTNVSSKSVSALSSLINKQDLERLHALQQLAFNESNDQQIEFTQQDGMLLLNAMMKKQSPWPKYQPFKFSIKLNPEK